MGGRQLLNNSILEKMMTLIDKLSSPRSYICMYVCMYVYMYVYIEM